MLKMKLWFNRLLKNLRKKRNNLTKKGKGWWYYRLCWGAGGNHRDKLIPLQTKDNSVANMLGKKK